MKKIINKFFGENKSIQRSLIVSYAIAIIMVLILSLISFYIFVNNSATSKLISINIKEGEEVTIQILDIIRRSIVIIIGSTILTSIILMRIMSKKILQPIKQITEATQKVSQGDFSVELETKREDEIGELTNNFNKMVKDLNKIELLQKDFINNVSHEIKTPISSIEGFAKLLDDDNISKEDRNEYIKIILEESNRLLNITGQVLKLSKLQNQDNITNKEVINISEQIRKTVATLEPKWREKNLTFNVSIDECFFKGNEDLTFQMWMNLIENAIKFSKKNGDIDITVKEGKNKKIFVKIQDYGIGIPKDQKDKIFDRFYQIDKSHSQEGSGLGLAIVKRIIELSQGSIKLESEEGLGSTFIIELPIAEEENKKVIIQ